ncbi:uncharacterized protein LOC131942436 [Physella acuta]|uniref:uncharacterized protein LOC131942436 n=1 Tax=Physella acuta TaxID=109671 RepID=UPI0027DCCB4A|nr:uncharacterized protein LOC131942436 [Physella acuta]XP_059158313.1 uncharacterized protein LOC131942436 [Physella acuta]XP_059158314.1 uncharacterized protein LOC131942436 [Physella acuta]XP_059158315.1 uncharacterized protein LOC131942436 [Physella acuta]XP_059158316.1 uncharacterized protein LOC131942436 [Physella acuta]XP_059158317.1 uncharacterized protein LOC131942436 [Physella acuta]XP_059158318.1 uncharacterized protein LOC131942436 [Physella acuta]XP_059158319.1 uncharacterized p
MPDMCKSCGETAVIEVDLDGQGIHKICIECASVASENNSNGGHGDAAPVQDVAQDNVCQSCGQTLSYSTVSAGQMMCTECLDEEGEEMIDDETDGAAVDDKGGAKLACISCASLDLGMELLGADERLICRSCGSVQDSENLVTDEFGTVTRSYGNKTTTLPKYASTPSVVKGRIAGHDKISLLQDKLCLSEAIKLEAVEMFDKVFPKKEVVRTNIRRKEHIAAACLFIVCRLHELPVCVSHFKPHLDRLAFFTKGKNLITQSLNLTLPQMNFGTHVGGFLEGRGFDKQIVGKVRDILFLCRRAWLTEGRSREGLITLAVYYAYLNSNCKNEFISLNKFRKMFAFPNVSNKLSKDCCQLLLKLARSLPWVDEKLLKPNTVYRYVDDIIKYQNSVFHLVFTQDLPTEFHKENCVEGQRELLLPPAAKRARKQSPVVEVEIPAHIDLDCPELKDTDFDKDEIASYILSEEEQENLKHLKQKAFHH